MERGGGGGGQALSQKLPMSGEAACAECGSHFDLIAFSPSHSRSSSRSRSRSRSLFVVCLFDWFAVVYFDFRFKYSNVEGARPLHGAEFPLLSISTLIVLSQSQQEVLGSVYLVSACPATFCFFLCDSACVPVCLCVCVCQCSRLVLTNRQRQHRMQPGDSSVIQ